MPLPFNANSACLNAVSDVIWLFANWTKERIESTCFLGVQTPCSQELPSSAGYQTGMILFLFHPFWVHKLTHRNTFPIGVSPVMLPYTKECFGQSALRSLWNNQWSLDQIAHLYGLSEQCASEKLINLWHTWSKLGYPRSLTRQKCPKGKHVVESNLETMYQDCDLISRTDASSNPILTNNQ